MRVGVLTFHRSINYGSYWQARCLVQGLRARGHEAELLDHRSVRIERLELRCAFQPQLPVRTPRRFHPALGRKARRMGEAVARLPLSAPFDMDDAAAGSACYDAVVVGSDEVWNFRHPWFGGHPLFFGEGLKAERLVSYAASFGNHDAHDGMAEHYAARLERFAGLSVRDDNARTLVRAATGRVPASVLDPCLAFPEAIGGEIAEGDYALVYGHGFPDWFAAQVRGWADRGGVRLVAVGYPCGFADEARIDATPAEFAALFAGARAVATNFFHGCVFALRAGKPLACAASPYRRNKLRDLTAALGAERCLLDETAGAADYAAALGEPPTGLAARLAEQRAASHAFLDAALG